MNLNQGKHLMHGATMKLFQYGDFASPQITSKEYHVTWVSLPCLIIRFCPLKDEFWAFDESFT